MHKGRNSCRARGHDVLFTGAALAQQPVDYSKIEIKTTDLGNKTYMLEGAAATSPSPSAPTASSWWTPSSRRCTTRSRRRSRKSRRCRSST